MPKEKIDPAKLHADLAQFTGTERYIQHALCKHVVFTDGVDYLRQHADCFWLVDAIASHLPPPLKCVEKYGEEFAQFHIWTLTQNGDGAVLEAKSDTHAPVKIKQEMEYTDFPFGGSGKFKLYVGPQEMAGGRLVYVIMLPSEN